MGERGRETGRERGRVRERAKDQSDGLFTVENHCMSLSFQSNVKIIIKKLSIKRWDPNDR